ncbi:DEAD/DEAH box helicase [Cohnella luojiensis]|uniref:RNA helicase n=1 Tax=Cohnella luojiensis TaxID=652876 RepID=A0A4Y8LZF4_9BACL|nr:DEAD/DEAH box helicase [Cohnella luojiensis]TFE27878.1 DEAD/DEAH box helicase [Cohnella luojiensis]
MGFIELGLNEALAEKLAASGISEPSDVQSQALPALLSGKDGVLVSPTGTGKTLAYLLPLLQKIDGTRRETQALVLAPTQELAMQIMREAEAYGQPLGIKATALIGGASLARQLERMKGKPALVVGTPGRVREVASTRKLSLHAISFVVVDETDRIFSLGGRSDVENLLRQCSRDRQTVFVSATRSEAMRDAEKKWQKDPWVSDVTEKENENGLSSTLQHWYFLSDRREKIDLIRRIVRHMKPSSALLFVNDTEKIGELLAKLRYEGVSVDALYGDTRGQERGEVMQRFRNGRTKLLIATDVAARGLDLPGLPLVVQFEPALDADHYVHRSGRTARMGKEGTSITLITSEERFIVDKLEKQLGIQVQPKMLYEGKVVSVEEGLARKGPPDERKPRSGDGEAKEQRPAWKSKAEFMATLEPKTEKKSVAESRPVADRRQVGDKRPDAESRQVGDKRPVADNRKNAVEKPRLGVVAKMGTPVRTRKPIDSVNASATSAATASVVKGAPAADKPQVKPPVKPAVKPAKTKAKSDRARDQKNKGAPKWLKEKRESASNDQKE